MYINSTYCPQKLQIQPKSKKQTVATSFKGFNSCMEKVVNRPFYPTEDFLKIATCFKNPVLGKLPKEFLSLYPENPKEVMTFLDEFACLSRNLKMNSYQKINLKIKLSSGKDLELEHLGSGGYGNVYKITADNKPFAFKAYFQDEFSDVHGSVAETRTNYHLGTQQYNDYFNFYMANTKNGKNWQISEFIDADSAKSRQGESVKKLHPELKFGDDGGANEIAGIRIDAGGIHKNHFNLSDFGMKDREKAFYDVLNSPHREVREGISSQVGDLPKENGVREKAFYDVLNSPHREVREGISSQIWYLTEENGVMEKAFYDVLNSPHPDVRAGISSQTWYLTEENGVMEKAFYDVLNSPHPEVRGGISSQIWSMPKENGVREKAFYDVLKSPHREVRAGVSSQVELLSEENGVMEKAFYDVLNNPHAEVRKGISSQVMGLSDTNGIMKKAFYDVLNSPHPEAREGISSQIWYFPEENGVREKATIDTIKKFAEDCKSFELIDFNLGN